MSLAPPSINLSDSDIARLELVNLPATEGLEEITVYRFSDTGEFVTDDEEIAALIREAFPAAKILQV